MIDTLITALYAVIGIMMDSLPLNLSAIHLTLLVMEPGFSGLSWP